MTDASPLEFPCDIPIKVFGRNEPQFKRAVLDVVKAHFPSTGPERVTERLSKADTFLSLTIVVTAVSRSQIDAAYRELTAHEHVMMVL